MSPPRISIIAKTQQPTLLEPAKVQVLLGDPFRVDRTGWDVLVHLTIRTFLPKGLLDLVEVRGSAEPPVGMDNDPELCKSAAATKKFIGLVGAPAPDCAMASGERVGAVGMLLTHQCLTREVARGGYVLGAEECGGCVLGLGLGALRGCAEGGWRGYGGWEVGEWGAGSARGHCATSS